MADRAFKIDFDDGDVVCWEPTTHGVESTRDTDYRPSIYVAGPDNPLDALRERLARDPKVVDTAVEEKYYDLHVDEPEPVLRLEVGRMADVAPLAREIRGLHERGTYAPGTFRLFDIDLSPQFRYCLDRGVNPYPEHELSTLEVSIGEKPLADGDVTALAVGGERIGKTLAATLSALERRLGRDDPDILVLSRGAIVPFLFDAADAAGIEGFQLGRRPGYTTLAGPNTYTSYGQVTFSPARYDVPGRAIIDTSNSFLWHKTGLDGILYFVKQAKRPIQEVAWGSIGTILTAMQTRAAREKDVLVPWNKWEPESFKTVETLHTADRGGFTFDPEVGFHEGVHEVDFASLYPNIMIEKNISPETVGCDRHPKLDEVPEIGYVVCEQPGFVPEVLKPMVRDRAGFKQRLKSADGVERDELEAKAEAIKWILVSCFGYQGYRNAKFGRIEAHEAINAYAREIMLETKAIIEDHGWGIVHGIVDSIWLRRVRADATPIQEVAARVTDAIGIRLEHENEFEWICFVPRRGSRTGALNRYFGKITGGGYKLRGIECRQHSTPSFVAEVQFDLIETLDTWREPAPVCDRLGEHLRRLSGDNVDPRTLLVATRATKVLNAYDRETHVVGALRRAERLGVTYQPGETVRYVVTDDGARRPEDGVRVHFEPLDGYDVGYYEGQLVRATESIVSPFGWSRVDVRRHLRGEQDASLGAYR